MLPRRLAFWRKANQLRGDGSRSMQHGERPHFMVSILLLGITLVIGTGMVWWINRFHLPGSFAMLIPSLILSPFLFRSRGSGCQTRAGACATGRKSILVCCIIMSFATGGLREDPFASGVVYLTHSDAKCAYLNIGRRNVTYADKTGE